MSTTNDNRILVKVEYFVNDAFVGASYSPPFQLAGQTKYPFGATYRAEGVWMDRELHHELVHANLVPEGVIMSESLVKSYERARQSFQTTSTESQSASPS